MKIVLTFASAIPLVLFAGYADAGRGHERDRDWDRHGEYAKVLAVRPIIETVSVSRPERQCWNETVGYRTRSDSATPTIVGGIIGGVVGNQFGEGKGKDAMTVAGALLGGSIGRNMGTENDERYPVTRQRCRTEHEIYEQDRVVGYHVTYRYHGREYTTRMPYDPGNRMKVRVHIEPEDD